MKYLALAAIAGGLFFFFKAPSSHPATAAAATAPTPGTDFLKAPLDRTHEVLDQARVRAADQP
jgi:hypothetical protein